MHPLALEKVVVDCIAYAEHKGPLQLIDRHSKELLAFAIADLAEKIKVQGDAMRAALSQTVLPNSTKEST